MSDHDGHTTEIVNLEDDLPGCLRRDAERVGERIQTHSFLCHRHHSACLLTRSADLIEDLKERNRFLSSKLVDLQAREVPEGVDIEEMVELLRAWAWVGTDKGSEDPDFLATVADTLEALGGTA